jgi:hypothetical protein
MSDVYLEAVVPDSYLDLGIIYYKYIFSDSLLIPPQQFLYTLN